jgi:hypothetical protein
MPVRDDVARRVVLPERPSPPIFWPGNDKSAANLRTTKSIACSGGDEGIKTAFNGKRPQS